MPETVGWSSVPAEWPAEKGSLPVSILVVDDEEVVRNLLVDTLADTGYHVSFASSAEDAIAQASVSAFDLVLSDVRLPGKDGIALANALTASNPGLPVILVTAYADTPLARFALQNGACDFIPKPVHLDTLSIVIEKNLERRRLDLERELEQNHLRRFSTIQGVAATIDACQIDTAQHSRRVAALSEVVAHRLALSSADTRTLFMAAQVHDVGKIKVSNAVLNKKGPLTEEEWVEMRTHSAVGADIVGRVPELANVANVVRAHHERMDGAGYPDGLSGEAIPLLARIVAVADAFESMTSNRVYRTRIPNAEAIRRLQECAGTHFDARIVEIFTALHDEGLVW